MIELEDVSVRCGAFALERVSLRLEAGEYAVLMGPSGVGKTTLLEAICGLLRVASGRVLLDGRDVTSAPPGVRGIGFVPQDTALFSSMSVHENIGYALRVRGADRDAAAERVESVARLLQIESLLDRRTAGLSGGEARRVAIGRAIAVPTPVLLLDEPLNGLDDATRDEVYRTLQDVLAATRCTVIHVTHDQRDADRLATRRLLFCEGRLSEAPTEAEALLKPPCVAVPPAWSRSAPEATARS